MTINGVQREVMASPELVLLDLLREEFHLTGTKQSCDRKGQCGTCTVIVDGKAVRYEGKKQIAGIRELDPETGQGDYYDSDVLNIQMAEVEVNMETGKVRVIKMTTAVDAGPIINPKNVEGQLQGGIDQGVGYALREQYDHGQTKDWITFKFPKIEDSLEVEIITRETPRINGALGATGVGEATMVCTAPEVINAINNACGVRIYDLPATPGKIKSALGAANK